jgi:Tfp pilus assembly protein PilF
VILLALLAACATPPEPTAPDACTVMSVPTPGPLQKEREKTTDPLARARLLIREARLAGDPGFYTLAETALDCALERKPDDPEALSLRAHVYLQFHRFAEVEKLAGDLTRTHGKWLDWALLGDAQMEQGKLEAAGESYQKAVNLRPGLDMYDRIGWLRWLWGDVDGALEMQQLAVSAGDPTDPEPFAWALTRMGWLHALQGKPAPELDKALTLVPAYKPALLYRGRIRLYAGDTAGAAEDFHAVGPTVEATRALLDIDPTTSMDAVKSQDPRGYAIWLSDTQPEKAIVILDEEWKQRQDATTRMARAYARFRAGQDAADEARAALATGIVEPRVLLQGGLILKDPALLARALASGPGLLPSERKIASSPGSP